jgi:hypothetical protein
MTNEQKIDALSNEIRKALPYLMELSEGCLIEDINTNEIHKVNSFHIQVGNVIRLHTTDLSNTFGGGSSFNYIPKHHKILGHEPILNDVLVWFSIKKASIMLISIFGTFYNHNLEYSSIEWNLEKPYLKDQSVELVNFLYSLIKP